MKTKGEVIKEAWGADYNLGVGIDENGWLSENYLTNDQCNLFNYDESFEYKNVFGYRPKSLHGIENNNGWIKIESEKDLPNGYCDLYLSKLSTSAVDSEDYIFYLMKDFNKSVGLKLKRALEYTHYQPINKPQPPLY